MGPGRADVAVVGSVNVDLVTTVRRLPRPGETVHAVTHEQFIGGKGGNQAVAAARLGSRVALVGLTGADAEGRAVRAALASESVDLHHLGTHDGVPTGRALVLVDADAENSIVVVAGANGALTQQHVERAAEVLRESAVVVAQLEVPVAAVTAAARLTAGTFVLNPAPAQALPAELVGLVDVLVVNETEYESVVGSPLPPDPEGTAAGLAEAGLVCSVVITLGARGALVWEGEGVTHLPAPAVPVVDTTGAGDAFIGALADGIGRGEQLTAAARWATRAAAISVGALGATTGMPSRGQVLALDAPLT